MPLTIWIALLPPNILKMIFSESCVSMRLVDSAPCQDAGSRVFTSPMVPMSHSSASCRQPMLSRDCETGNCRDYQETLHTFWSCQASHTKYAPLQEHLYSFSSGDTRSLYCERSLKFVRFKRLDKIHVWFLCLSAILKPFECCVRKTPSSLYNVNDQVGER